MTTPVQNSLPDAEPLLRRILTALAGIHYGSVEIIVHDSRVVQIERKEKLRIDSAPTANRKQGFPVPA